MGIYATNRPLGVGMPNAPPRHFAKKFFSPITQHPKTSKRTSFERCRFWTADLKPKKFFFTQNAKAPLMDIPTPSGETTILPCEEGGKFFGWNYPTPKGRTVVGST